MARKKREQAHAALPQSADEVWEVGRRPLAVSVAEPDLPDTQPELVLVVQVNEPGGVVLGRPLASDAPMMVLAGFTIVVGIYPDIFFEDIIPYMKGVLGV